MEIITSATIFKAFDGTIFESETQCTEYERRKNMFLKQVEYFLVRHSPDLNETGILTEAFLVAVYSTSELRREIVMNYCIKRFGYLGPSVQGYGFQHQFCILSTDYNTYMSGVVDDWKGRQRYDKILLSPIELDEIKDVERIDYMKEWGFK